MDDQSNNPKNNKVIITSSGFGNWLWCKYRWGYEKRETDILKNKEKKDKEEPATHKWLQK